MLDVHPPHSPTHTWKDFLIHIATIVVGLLIAVGLEQTVEYVHHRHQISETRDALREEQKVNQKLLEGLVAEFRTRTSVMQANLALFHYLQTHPGAPASQLPAHVTWHSGGIPFILSVWQTAQHGNVLDLMPAGEVRDDARLYRMLETSNLSFAAFRSALTEARAYTVDAASVSDLSPAQIEEQIRLTRNVLNRLYRLGADLRNLYVFHPQFAPAPSIEELAAIVHEPASEREAIENSPDPFRSNSESDAVPAAKP